MERSTPGVAPRAAKVVPLQSASLGGGHAHWRAVANSLALADEAAATGDYINALSWLHMLDAIGEELPASYLAKRRAWAEQLTRSTTPCSAISRSRPDAGD